MHGPYYGTRLAIKFDGGIKLDNGEKYPQERQRLNFTETPVPQHSSAQKLMQLQAHPALKTDTRCLDVKLGRSVYLSN